MKRLLVLFLLSCWASAEAKVVDRIAAIVETDVVTMSEVDAHIKKRPDMVARLQEAEDKEEILKKLRSQALEQLVAETLLEAEIRRRNIKATELQIERAFELQIRANKTTRERFLAELRKAGISVESYRADLGTRIQRQLLMEQLFLPKIKVSETDIRNYYTQNVNTIRDESVEYCVSHILLQTPAAMKPKARQEQLQRAEKLLARLKKGEDFASLARQFSQDPSAAQGGSLGCFRKGVMVPEFEKVVFALQKGELSPAIKTRFGYHIARMNDVKGSSVLPYDKVRNQIRVRLIQDQLERQVRRWVASKKKTAFVEKKL